MSFRICSYEKELSQELKDGRWPDGCGEDLRIHVAGCELCRELVLVAESFQNARRESLHAAPTGSPSLLWWKAQLRRKHSAEQHIARPITIAQVFAFVVTLLVAAVFFASQYNHGLRWASWEINPSKVLHLLSLGSADWSLLLLLPGMGAVLLLSGIVLYLARERS